jgi:hypothetical protein
MTTPHRFTGRELSALLEQVREELGAEATILEASKVRTGGVAGFFKSEEFEVIATAGEPTITLGDGGGSATLHLDMIAPEGTATPALTSGHRTARSIDGDTLDIRTPTDRASRPSPLPLGAPHSTHGATSRGDTAPTALLDRVDTISIQDRIGLSQPATDPGRSKTSTDRRFGDVLSTELKQPDISVRSTSTDEFWDRLGQLGAAVGPLDLESQIVVVLGNRASAMSVARRLEAKTTEQRPALAAVSPVPHDLDMPQWQKIDNMTELGDRLRFWEQSARTGIVIIDADLGADATSMVERVRAAGSRVLHLAIDDELSPKRIFSLMQRLGGNVVVDLTFRATPEYVLSLIDRQVPLATVDGHEVNGGLVFALKQVAHHG